VFTNEPEVTSLHAEDAEVLHGLGKPINCCQNIILVALNSDYDSLEVAGYARPILARACLL
jgi:hypothetical protein